MTWMLLAKHFAFTNTLEASFNYDNLNVLTAQIAKILHENINTIKRLTEIFNQNGILFGVVKKIDGAAIDGYSFEYNGHPCIIVTMRYDKIDNLAFAVMHELGHIINHDNEDCRINLEDYDHESPEEKAANTFAADALIPNNKWKQMPKVQMYPNQIQRIYTTWAIENGYNKWIALGRIAHETGMFKFKSDPSRKVL